MMKIAVEGCAHGELEQIYETIDEIEKQENYKVDLLICCGDFQATRNLADLRTMAVSQKYQNMCSFYKYYSGEKVAPVLTIFIGGNHEASNYLQELPYGGWVAPNIYYLGYAGVININGIRIGGVSGIYKSGDYFKGRFEFSPYTDSTMRSVYHVRQLEVFRLKQLSKKLDIFLSHDWPRGIYNHGNAQQLCKFKPFFREEVENNKLGSPPLEDLLNVLKPKYWFAAHLHCKFAALVEHEEGESTKFLALDKCLPQRRFLQMVEIECDSAADNIQMEYDTEWLTILAATNHLINAKPTSNYMPGPTSKERSDFTPTEDEIEETKRKLEGNLKIPENFTSIVDAFNPDSNDIVTQQPKAVINPQTSTFCETLGIDDPLVLAMMQNGLELNYSDHLEVSGASDCNSTLNNSVLSETSSPLKRKSLTLPEPVGDNRENSFSEDIVILEEEEHIPDQSTEKEEDSSPIKKLKRRNANIYESNDNE